MAYFALLWKARAVEKYRLKYEKEKINSIAMAEIEMPKKTLFQKWRHYKYDTQKRISRRFREWYPEDSTVSNFLILLKTDQTVPNFVLKSLIGFIGGIVLTYIFFIFFVFQLSISFMHAIIMSSIIGILLTLGLAFSYRIRCLVFLLIPQFFSRVGRYTLTCYALVLILTGPATNTLKNSEVLSESMACTQEQIKTNAQQLNESLKKPINVMKESIKPIMDRFNDIANKLKWTTVKINRLTLSIVSVIQSNFSYLKSITKQCNQYLGTPYRRCIDSLEEGLQDCLETFGRSWLSDAMYIAKAACSDVLVHKKFCAMMEYLEEDIIAGVKKKIETFSERLACLLNMEVNIHHSYKFSSNGSRSTSQVTAGIVTEIRKRADPLLTWLSWSSCVTSLSLLFIIFRAKYYQHMYETRSRFDNRYITQELRDLDLKRLREGRDTILPLNMRERAKYITTTSFSLVASERLYMSRSAVFMSVTTFKLLIHMVADYSLYWVLMTIRYHGKRQSPMQAGVPETGAHVTGSGFVTNLLRSIIETLNIPLESPVPSPIPCLPNPIPPDFKRYTQIGLLIFLLWFFALFEPYGLRLRHVVMGHYRPERAKTRAVWLYNHILRTRGSFMKLARRKLHKEYKYSSESKHTFKRWLDSIIPLQCLRTLLGTSPVEPHCLLCGTRSVRNDLDSDLTRCETRDCPGIYCMRCFSDIGQLCTICMSPTDYGDLSDIDLEKGSSDESDPSEYEYDDGKDFEDVTHRSINWYKQDDDKEDTKTKGYDKHYKCRFYSDDSNRDNIPLLPEHSHTPSKRKEISSYTRYDHNLLYLFKLIHIETKELFDHSVLLYDFDNKNLFNKIICDSQNNKILCLSNYSICRPRAHSSNKYFNKPSKLFTCHTQGYRNSVNSENKNSNIKSEFYKFVISRRLLLTEILTQTTAYEIVKDKSSIVVTKIKRDNELSTRLKRKFSLLRRRKKNRDKSQQNCRNIFRYYMNIVNQNICNFNKDLPENFKNNLKINNTKNRNNDKKEEKKSKKKSKIPNISKNITKEADVQKSKDPKKTIITSKFSVICSKYWNNFKWNLIPCTEFVKISKRQTIASKSLNNFKRRKKPVQEAKLNEDNKAPIENKEDMRNFKLSAYLYEQEWVKMKCNEDVETTADNLPNISEEQEQKVKYDIIETKSLIEEVMNDKNMANSFNKELIQQLSETIEEGVKDLSQTPDVICMSLLNRYHRRAKALKCFGRKVKCTDNTTSPVASFKRNHFIDKGCCVRQKSKPVNRRNKKCVKCSCPLNQRDLLTSSCKGNSEANKDNKEAANLTEEDLNDKEEDADCEIGKVLDDKDESKKCDEDGKGFEKYAVLFEKLQNSYLTIKKFYSTIFTELFVKSNTCRNCTCETSDMKEVKVEKATRVRLRTRSCGCQCLTRNQEQTTQIGRPLVEVSQSVSEKFAFDEEVDATHHRHTCTCAAQQVILSRDVGTLRKSHRRFATTGDKASIKFNVSSSSLDSFKSISSNSSDGTKTDTTICSVVTFYDDITHHNRSDINNDTRHRRADYKPEQYRHTRAEYDERARHRPRKYRTKVVTKTNQSTLTDKTKFCDVSTITNDWWSPIVEKKDLKGLETRRHYVRKKEKKYLKNTGVCTDGKIVTFRSRTQIIPPGTIDILSPSRYLLESQRYYNELFAYNLYNPHFVGFSQTQSTKVKDWNSAILRENSKVPKILDYIMIKTLKL